MSLMVLSSMSWNGSSMLTVDVESKLLFRSRSVRSLATRALKAGETTGDDDADVRVFAWLVGSSSWLLYMARAAFGLFF